MNGGVRKRGKKWYYYFDAGKVNGKRNKIERVGGRTKKEAQEALAQAINEYNHAGSVRYTSDITVADFLDQWYEMSCRMNLKYSSQVGYLRLVEGHIKPKFGMYKIRSLTPAILQEYANSLKMNGYSKSHIVGILTTFQAALDYAVEPLHYINCNPMKAVRIPKIEKSPRERIVLTTKNWERIQERFYGTRYYIPLMIGFYTGLRISETFALTWDDIDFKKKTLTVNKQVVKRNYGADVRKEVEKKKIRKQHSFWYFTTPKTHSSQRTIMIGDTLCSILEQELERQMMNERARQSSYILHVLRREIDEKGNDMLRLLPIPCDEPTTLPRVRLICIKEDGSYTSTDSFKYCSRVIHNELKIEFDYHSLRHTHATLLVEAGADIKNVQARLGHQNIETTLQTYVHDTTKMSRKTVQLFEKITHAKYI